MQRRDKADAGLFQHGGFFFCSAFEGSQPQFAPDTVGLNIVFQPPRILLGNRGVTGFDDRKHFLDRISVGHSPQRRKQEARGSMGGRGHFAGNIARNTVGRKHGGQHARKARVAHHSDHIAVGYAVFMQQHHFLRRKMGFKVWAWRGVQAYGGGNIPVRRGTGLQILQGKMRQFLRPARFHEGKLYAFKGYVSLLSGFPETGDALAHRRKHVLLAHDDQGFHLVGQVCGVHQQPDHLPGQGVKAVHRHPRVLHDAAVGQAQQHIVHHVLAVHELTFQLLFINREKQRQIPELIFACIIGKAFCVSGQRFRRHARLLAFGDDRTNAFYESLLFHSAFVITQLLLA